ncbi:MAG: hypothetical protein IT388_08010 [Nitrospirales bacterium]|nr:hypothetical protein [Nitrospirales bacterium]
MRSGRRYNFGILFPTLIAISLLSSLSVAYGKDSRAKNILSYRIVPLSSRDSLVLFGEMVESLFEETNEKRSHSGFEVFLFKLRALPEKNWVAKIQFLNNSVKVAESGSSLCGFLRCVPPGLTPAHGFLFAFSGLSPPSL